MTTLTTPETSTPQPDIDACLNDNPLLEVLGEMTRDLKHVDIDCMKKSIAKTYLRSDLTDDEKKHILVMECRSKEISHYEWSLLAGRLRIRFVKETIPKKFSEAMKVAKPLLLPSFYDFVVRHADMLDEMVVDSRDNLINIFAAETLIGSYLARFAAKDKNIILETPQYMYLRVATFLWYEEDTQTQLFPGKGDNSRIKQVYDDLSLGLYSHATPTLFNSGMKKHQLASCFTMTVGDNLDGDINDEEPCDSIINTWGNVARISQNAGGLGIDYTALRHSEIAGTGRANGVVGWIKIHERLLVTVDQCFEPSTTVYTIKGPKMIGNITAGDTVIRADGQKARVRKAMHYECLGNESFRRLRTKMCPEGVKVTDRHPFLSLNFSAPLSGTDAKYAIDEGLYVPTYLEAREITRNTYVATPIPMYEKDMSVFTEEDCFFYGLVYSKSVICGLTVAIVSNEFVDNYLTSRQVEVDDDGASIAWKLFERNTQYPFTKKMFVDSHKVKRFFAPFLHLPLTKLRRILEGMTHEGRIYGNIDVVRYICLRLGVLDVEFGCQSSKLVERADASWFVHDNKAWFKVASNEIEDDNVDYVVDLQIETPKIASLEEDIYANYTTAFGIAHNGGQKRKGSGTGYLCDWHIDIEEFIDLKNPLGTEDNTAKNMTFAVNIHDEFMRRVERDEEWTLFCPAKTDNLVDKWGVEFEKEYRKLEAKARAGEITDFRVVRARDLLQHMEDSMIKSGSPFVLFIDAVNRKTNQKRCIRLSNLCMEITLRSDRKNIGSCILGAVNLDRCVTNLQMNYSLLERLSNDVTMNLNQVIDRNFYHKKIPAIRRTNLKNRPNGLGYMGLADAIAKLDYELVSPETDQLNVYISETMYYASVKASVELAKVHGPYSNFHKSPASKGILQFDMWKDEKIEKELRHLSDKGIMTAATVRAIQERYEVFTFTTGRYDWDALKKDVIQYGMRNSLLIALMPTATSAYLLGVNECFEPYTQHIFTRTVLGGQHVVTNKHLVDDLVEIGLWNTSVVRNLWRNKGSIQNIPSFSFLSEKAKARLAFLKRKYPTVYEVKQRYLQKLSIERGPFICQTQSYNCWMKNATKTKLTAYLFNGWLGGVKTGIYYLRQPAAADPQDHSIRSIRVRQNPAHIKQEYVCESCSV